MKKKTLNSVMIGIVMLAIVAVFLWLNTLQWMFTQTQFGILMMAMLAIGASVLIFGAKW